MKEAIANVGVFNLIIIFVTILLSFFVGSLGYSKAFKVKNLIVNEIEKNKAFNNEVSQEIEDSLSKIGYRMNTSNNSIVCPIEDGQRAINQNSNYQYCVYEFRNTTGVKSATFYRVVAYMYFDVPIFNDLVNIPVRGETISFVEINS